MKNITRGQFAIGGFGFLGLWHLILSQAYAGVLTGYGILFGGFTDYAQYPPLILISIILWGLAITCFYRATKPTS